jgi:hypothetical protein
MGAVTGDSAIAIGYGAGIGSASLSGGQNASAVAIGKSAGAVNQGTNAVAIGALAGTLNQNGNSICLNASGSALNTTASGFFVNPVRNVTPATTGVTNVLTYTSNEIQTISTALAFPYLQEVTDPLLSRSGRAGGIVSYTYDPSTRVNTNTSVAANTTFVIADYFYAGQVITSLGMVATSTPLAVTSQIRIGLYTGAGVRVAQTDIIGSADTLQVNTYTFFPVVVGVTPTPYTIPTTGFYYLAVGCITAVTGVTFNSNVVSNAAVINYPQTAAITTGAISGLRIGTFANAGTHLPTPLSGISVTTSNTQYLIAAI